MAAATHSRFDRSGNHVAVLSDPPTELGSGDQQQPVHPGQCGLE